MAWRRDAESCEKDLPSVGWGMSSQCSVFPKGCRVRGGEFDFHRFGGFALIVDIRIREIETKLPCCKGLLLRLVVANPDGNPPGVDLKSRKRLDPGDGKTDDRCS
jgi:hypothetical protein